ncbi:MAG: hypothetical protein FJY75_00910 [Candidatus Eisenbacteria bacterium]|uniref:Uncharacterized protein n=1 Tax=Eiseniibacteriota bacterium TaxID=2212470 RepID=A0A937X5T7_UNCEI|nr:hypothetical protein [Candidatus Eisenbacteria bacterium]
MRRIVPLLLPLLALATARGERLLIPDVPPHASRADEVSLGEGGDFLDFVRIDGGVTITIAGPGLVEGVARGHVESRAAAPESLRVTVEGLAAYPPQHWSRQVLLAREFGYEDGRPGRMTTPLRFTFAVPRGVHRLRVHGAGAPGEPVYARLVYDGPPSAEEAEAARFARVTPLPPRADSPALPVGIGQGESFTGYYGIDAGARLLLEGPGLLRLFVRAAAPPGSDEPRRVVVSITGLEGFGEQRWVEPLRRSRRDTFADDRPGRPTGAARILCPIPEGRHTVTLRGATAGGDPVFAACSYQGPPPKRSPWRLAGDFSFECIYDDNIARFSEATLQKLRSGLDPAQFGIDIEDDLILHPVVGAEITHGSLLFRKATRLRLRVQRWEYMRNPIKTNDEVQVRLRQHFRHGDYLEAMYTYAPDGYIKELGDRPPYLSRTVPREYLPFEITRNAFDVGYRYRANAWLALRAGGGRVLRFYNRHFLENDLWEWNADLYAEVSKGRFSVRPEYGYALVKARGYDQVGETLENSDNDGDGSYEKDTYRLRVAYRPRTVVPAPGPLAPGLAGAATGALRHVGAFIERALAAARTSSCEAQLTYSRQFYTSTRPLFVDPLHVGRFDESRQIQLGWNSRPVYKRMTLSAGLRYTERTAKAPAGLIGENDPSEEKDYTGARYWIAVALPWR